MGRRFFVTCIALALAAAAWVLARPAPRPDEGLVVHVRVVDPDGEPVVPVQLLQVYDDDRVSVDARGRARLTHVTLRAADEASAAALALAVRPLARYHAPRHGVLPEASRRDDGSWDLVFRLAPHGILRLLVKRTHLGRCRAYLEPDPEQRRWASVGGHGVVRPGGVVDFRVFGGWDEVPVRIVGEPDAEGAVAVATQRLLARVPSPGHVVQLAIDPEEVQPIIGTVVPPGGPLPPTLAGSVAVTQIDADGRRLPLGRVPVGDDGTFVLRETGSGRYELTAVLDFWPEPTAVQADGGGSVEIHPAEPARWAVVAHPGLDARTRAIAVTVRAKDDGEPREPVAPAVRPGEDESIVALPGAGSWRVTLRVAGTNAHAPLSGEQDVAAIAPGPHAVAAALAEIPHGTLVVTTTARSWKGARTALVRANGRRATLVKGARPSVELRHVPAGTFPVEIEWADAAATVSRADVTLPAGGRREVTLARTPAR